MKPNILFICHLVRTMETSSNMSIRKRRPSEQMSPFDTTEIDCTVALPKELIANRSSHGIGSLNNRYVSRK